MELELSPLQKTWILDLDGTILKHNGHLNNGDVLLDGAKTFIEGIYNTDRVIILTSRKGIYRENTISFLKQSGIRYHDILFDIPYGERIVINDKKPSGLKTALAVNVERDEGIHILIDVNENL